MSANLNRQTFLARVAHADSMQIKEIKKRRAPAEGWDKF